MDGYLVFRFVRGHTTLVNDIDVHEFVYLTKDAFNALLTFLNRQADQVRRIHFMTHDDNLHYVVNDPRDGSDELLHPISHPTRRSGVGLMYRIVDTQLMFDVLGNARFGPGECSVKIEPDDSFLPENTSPVAVTFRNGRATHCKCDVDVTIRLGIAELSSLLMGTVPFSKLRAYGLVGMSDPAYTDVLDAIFDVDEKPQCTTSF
jgi:predicted acetyltransferase